MSASTMRIIASSSTTRSLAYLRGLRFGCQPSPLRLEPAHIQLDSGWLVGAGIEWAFAPNWSAKVEYNYLGLDDRTFIVPAGVPGFLPGDTSTQSNRNIQMVKVGINYLFNWSGYRY